MEYFYLNLIIQFFKQPVGYTFFSSSTIVRICSEVKEREREEKKRLRN